MGGSTSRNAPASNKKPYGELLDYMSERRITFKLKNAGTGEYMKVYNPDKLRCGEGCPAKTPDELRMGYTNILRFELIKSPKYSDVYNIATWINEEIGHYVFLHSASKIGDRIRLRVTDRKYIDEAQYLFEMGDNTYGGREIGGVLIRGNTGSGGRYKSWVNVGQMEKNDTVILGSPRIEMETWKIEILETDKNINKLKELNVDIFARTFLKYDELISNSRIIVPKIIDISKIPPNVMENIIKITGGYNWLTEEYARYCGDNARLITERYPEQESVCSSKQYCGAEKASAKCKDFYYQICQRDMNPEGKYCKKLKTVSKQQYGDLLTTRYCNKKNNYLNDRECHQYCKSNNVDCGKQLERSCKKLTPNITYNIKTGESESATFIKMFPLYRYYTLGLTRNAFYGYTKDRSHPQIQRLLGYMYFTQVGNTIPVYEHIYIVNGEIDDVLLSTSPDESENPKIIGYAEAEQTGDNFPIYRYYSLGKHILVRNKKENLDSETTYEGIAFYIQDNLNLSNGEVDMTEFKNFNEKDFDRELNEMCGCFYENFNVKTPQGTQKITSQDYLTAVADDRDIQAILKNNLPCFLPTCKDSTSRSIISCPNEITINQVKTKITDSITGRINIDKRIRRQ